MFGQMPLRMLKKFSQGPCPGKPDIMSLSCRTSLAANRTPPVDAWLAQGDRASHYPDVLMDRMVPRFVTILALGSVPLWASACGGEGSLEGNGETISRDRFMETYVELRTMALQSTQSEISLADRNEILESQGVTEEDLLAFVEYWGADGEVMLGIWEDLDSIMMETRMAQGEELDAEAEEGAREERGDEGGDRPDPGGNRGGEGGGTP